MIHSTQKVIRIGSSGGVTIPAKELKRQNIKFGDEVEVTIKRLPNENEDKRIIDAAKSILSTYKQDFVNLSER